MLSHPVRLFRTPAVIRSRRGLLLFPSLLLLVFGRPARAIDQWASSVLDFSSQYSTGSWSAAQAIGPANTFSYGDNGTAWTSSTENGTHEYLEMGFDTPVHANGVTIRETYGNGFVYQVDVLDTSNVLHTVWTGTDSSLQGSPANFLVTWAATSYLVKGVKIYVDTDHSTVWEEIDAVQLHDPSVPSGPTGPQWASTVIGFSSAYGTNGYYSPDRALNEPDIFRYGDNSAAWTPSSKNGTLEYLELGFATPVQSNGATIRETNGNGFVYQIDALDTNNVLHTVWTGTDTSQPGTPVDFHAFWTSTPYLTKGLKIYVNTDHAPNDWEEIDAVQLLDAAADVTTWATSVVDFSSQYAASGGYSADQALGYPDILIYGDNSYAWTPANVDGTQEYLTLGFDTPLLSDGALIRESSGNGFVTRVDALDLGGTLHTVWTGVDPSLPNSVVNFHPTWTRTTYPVRGLKIYVDTNHAPSTWEEVDAMALLGTPAVNPAPAITSLGPNPALRGGPSFALVVNGAGFTAGSAVLWNGTALATTFVSPTLVTALVPAANMATNGTATITVTNPAPGGGGSGPMTLTIGPALWGDVDGNGTRDMADVRTAVRIAGGFAKATGLNGGDVSPVYPASTTGYGDRHIQVDDAVRIARFINGL